MKKRILVIAIIAFVSVISTAYFCYKVNKLRNKIDNDTYKIQEYQKFVNYALSHSRISIIKFQQGEYSIIKMKNVIIFEPKKSYLDFYGITIQYDSINNDKIKEIWLHKP